MEHSPINLAPLAQPIPTHRGRFATKDGKIYTSIIRRGQSTTDYGYPIRELSQTTTKDGYKIVSVLEGHKCEAVHRLVYKAFRGLITDDYEIDHKDFDRENNNIDNLQALEWRSNRRRRQIAGGGTYRRYQCHASQLAKFTKRYEALTESNSKIRFYRGKYYINFMRLGRYISPRIFGFPVQFDTAADALVTLKRMYKIIYIDQAENN